MTLTLTALLVGAVSGWISCSLLQRSKRVLTSESGARGRVRTTAPEPYIQRSYIHNAVQIAECGGPCSQGARYCDCGALWLDTYIAKPLPYPTIDQ